MKTEGYAEVVQVAFKKEEWEVLMANADFSQRLKHCCKTLDDVEKLCAIGEDLISSWKQSKSPYGYL
jgi:hypothetical protein